MSIGKTFRKDKSGLPGNAGCPERPETDLMELLTFNF